MLLTTSVPAQASEAEILADLKAFFATTDPDQRAGIVARIEKNPSYRREKVGEWLHKLPLFPPLAAGRKDLVVPVGHGKAREVMLRVSRGYTPGREWPLVYLLHPSGSNGPSFMGYLERALGPAIEEFLVAAPSAYRQTGLDAPPPFTVDHLSILEAVRRTAHVDADRTYVVGYSTGGYAAWSLALFHPDQIAGSVAIASAFTVPPDEDGLWKAVLPNFAHVPVIHLWGARDTLSVTGFAARTPTIGSIAQVNERFRQWTRGMKLPMLQDIRIPNKGHGGLVPPERPFRELLSRKRVHYPKSVDQTYRHIHQGHAYWLEAHAWAGDHWGESFPSYRAKPGESDAKAMGRAILERLGRLRGEVRGQTLAIESRHVADMTVWLGEGMIDWTRPVSVEVGGQRVFLDNLEPDLFVCLSQAARTYDFDRLRWAGVRIDGRLRATPVNGRTPFPVWVLDPDQPLRSPRRRTG